MKFITPMMCTLMFVFSISIAAEIPGHKPPLGEDDRISYSIGYQIGRDLKKQGRGADQEAMLQGLSDALKEQRPLLKKQEMDGFLRGVKNKIYSRKKKELSENLKNRQQIKETYRGEGRDFLTANAQKEGVVTLPSGLQYKVMKSGTGKTPGPTDTVVVAYTGTLIDGSEFDSSHRNDSLREFQVNGVIKGWTEALQLMKEGSRWKLFIPADLAYGERGPLADRPVIYDLELVSIKPSD